MKRDKAGRPRRDDAKADATALTEGHKRKSTYVRKYASDAEANEARRITGKAAALKQSAARQAANVAAGKPPLAYVAEGRTFRFIEDPEVETLWLAEAEKRVANYGRLSRTEQRRAALRLADAYTARLAAAASSGTELPGGVDSHTLMTYWETEARLWRERSARDIDMAARHARMADDAERELGFLLIAEQRGTR